MNRKIVMSLVVIVILVAALLVINRRHTSSVPELATYTQAADSIVVRKADAVITLNRDGTTWRINEAGYPADRGLVSTMETRMKDLALTDLISDRPHYERYDLNPAKAIEVTVKSGNTTLRHVYLGKKSSTYRHTYVRLAERPEIYLASGSLSDDFNKSIDDFRDREIVKISKGAVESFELVNRGRKLSFSKTVAAKDATAEAPHDAAKDAAKGAVEKTDTWVCNEYKTIALDQERISQLLMSFDPLRAAGFSDADVKTLRAPACSVKIKAFGKQITLNVYRKLDENKYLCASSESPYAFTLDAWKAEKFVTTIDDLKAKK